MVSAVEHDFYVTLVAFLATAEVLIFVFHAQDANIYRKDQQEIAQILLGRIHHHFVHVAARGQLYLPFHYALDGFVLGVRPVYGWVSLQRSDQIITVVLGFTQHGDMSGVQHVERAEGDANLLAFAFETFDVIEYHL